MSSPTVRSRLASIIEQVDTSQRRKLILPFKAVTVDPGKTGTLFAMPQHMFAGHRLAVSVLNADPSSLAHKVIPDSELAKVTVVDFRTGTGSNFSTQGGVSIRDLASRDLRLQSIGAGIQHAMVVSNESELPILVYATLFGDAIRYSGITDIRESLRHLWSEVPEDAVCVEPKSSPEVLAAMRRILAPSLAPQVSESPINRESSWLPFQPTMVAAGDATIEVSPYDTVQIAEMDVSSSNELHDALVITDILVGGVSQFVGTGVVPASHLRGQKLAFDRLNPGQTVALRVHVARDTKVSASALVHRPV